MDTQDMVAGPVSDPQVQDVVKSPLTPRERQIVRLVAQGCSNVEIADRFRLQPQTVKNQLTQIYRKLGVRSRLQLAVHVLARHDGFDA